MHKLFFYAFPHKIGGLKMCYTKLKNLKPMKNESAFPVFVPFRQKKLTLHHFLDSTWFTKRHIS